MKRFIFWISAMLCFSAAVTGCQSGSDSFSDAQQKTIDHIKEVAQRTDGDWSKTTADDKKFLIDGPGGGNEATAKMVLSANAGKVSHSPALGKRPN